MWVKRLNEAKPYVAPNHFDMRSLRLQGLDAGGSKKYWVGLSYFLPGGGAGPDSSPLEKTYVVLEGEVTLRAGGQEAKLGPMDSVTIAADEVRELKNESNSVATMLVILPTVEAAK